MLRTDPTSGIDLYWLPLLFRYEIRRWREGKIPDIAEAVESPLRLSGDPERARGYSRSRVDVPVGELDCTGQVLQPSSGGHEHLEA